NMNWNYGFPALDSDFVEGFYYTAVVAAFDTAGSSQTIFNVPSSSRTFLIDRSAPASSISFPADDSDGQSGRYKSANIGKNATGSEFNGAANDFPVGLNAGVGRVEIRLSYLLSGDTWYWINTGFSSGAAAASQAWRGASYGANSWIYVENDIA